MKLMIASDIHGSAFYCKELLKAFENEHADKILLLGDILYHGPRNDLPKGYAPKEVIAMLNGIKESDPIPGTIVKTDDIITYKLTLINDGGLDCTHAMIRDVIPTHTAYVEGSATDGGT
ncbi:MAG: metallophosphoesterase family protein, partial [Oscillospiraceae bacterium]|nr:metallophosphoesterase family protein [Oscillospiraceae bacterium]